jgi:hypothetical protein
MREEASLTKREATNIKISETRVKFSHSKIILLYQGCINSFNNRTH